MEYGGNINIRNMDPAEFMVNESRLDRKRKNQPGKVKWLVLAALVLTVIAAYWYWTRTPYYALYQIRQAIENQDVRLFVKYVDMESILPNIISQAVAAKRKPAGQWEEEALINLAAEFIDKLKPDASGADKNAAMSARLRLDEKKRELDSSPFMTLVHLYQKGGEGAKWRNVESVVQDGSQALAGIKFYYPRLEADLVLEVKMKMAGSYWRVTEVHDLAKFVYRLEELEKTKIASLNTPIRQEMAKTLAFEALPVDKGNWDGLGLFKEVRFPYLLKNVGKRAVKETSGVIVISNREGKLLLRQPVIHSEVIAPGSVIKHVWRRDIIPFRKNDELLYDTSPEQIVVEWEMRQIVFQDGQQLKLHDSLPY